MEGILDPNGIPLPAANRTRSKLQAVSTVVHFGKFEIENKIREEERRYLAWKRIEKMNAILVNE
jgi:hypothetical protein